MSIEKSPIVCIDFALYEDDDYGDASIVDGETSEERWANAQLMRHEWAAEVPPGEVRELVVEIEWENGIAHTIYQDLAHPSTEQELKDTSITANILERLQSTSDPYYRYIVEHCWTPTGLMPDESPGIWVSTEDLPLAYTFWVLHATPKRFREPDSREEAVFMPFDWAEIQYLSHSPEPQLRAAGLRVLDAWPEPLTRELLAELLGSEFPEVRLWAVRRIPHQADGPGFHPG